jgi:hypothetical protein
MFAVSHLSAERQHFVPLHSIPSRAQRGCGADRIDE